MHLPPCKKLNAGDLNPELLFLARKLHFKVVEIPVEWAHREGTRINALRDGSQMFFEMLRIRWNSLTGKYNYKAQKNAS